MAASASSPTSTLLSEARTLAANAHNDHWRQRHERTVEWLRLAIAEARSRIPEELVR
jgi:hypothetical protein